jgi:putative heme-binding domain-containing protein
MPIESIAVYNRGDGDFGQRLDGFTIKVLDKSRKEVFRKDGIPAPDGSATFELNGGDQKRAIRRAAMTALVEVRGQEANAFKKLSKYVNDDLDRITAIRALQRIGKDHWPREDAAALLAVVVAYLRKLPVTDRTSPEALDAMEFAHSLASLLPPRDAKKARAELAEIGVRVIRLGTLLERMTYDKDLLVVKAGKPVEIIFENTDLMPHNLVITRPGTMEEIGRIAEDTATLPETAVRQYVPQSPHILLASRLLQPRQSQKLSFTAPTAPGVYPYVCTYPGHWRRMYGALYVVEDLDAYLENPEAYLASAKLEIKDELLKDRRPRTEWKYEDLSPGLAELQHGRNFGNAKQLFTVANCSACHKLNGIGTELGPDLSKLDTKLQAADILKEMLDPSAIINEKYQTYLITLQDGKTLTGLIIADSIDGVTIVENPLAGAKPVVVKPRDIAEREKAAVSVMPKGLLDKLSRDEILDLVAYVVARGSQDHPVFQGGGHNHSDHKH